MIQLHILFTLVAACIGFFSAVSSTSMQQCRLRGFAGHLVTAYWALATGVAGLAGWCLCDALVGPVVW